MTVSELIEMLQDQDQDAEVHIAYDYGDHVHTTVAPAAEECEVGCVRYSDYHRMDKIVEDEGQEDEDVKRVVVIQ